MSKLNVTPSRYWQLKIDNSKAVDGVKTTDYNEFITGEGFIQRRVVFNILQDFGGSISYADIKIYGLSDSTVYKYLRAGSAVQFVVGYQTTPIDDSGNNEKTINNFSDIFTGRIKNSFKSGLPPETYLQLYCISGSQPTMAQKSINITLGKPAKVVDIIKKCATAMGYHYRVDSNIPVVWEDYKNGFTATGNPKEILNSLAYDKKFNWILEKDIVVVVPSGASRSSTIQEISWRNGMVGIPQINESGINVVVNLRKRLFIGNKIKIKSEIESFNYGSLYFENIPVSAGNGEVAIERIQFTGDNYGDRWDQQITGFFKTGYFGHEVSNNV